MRVRDCIYVCLLNIFVDLLINCLSNIEMNMESFAFNSGVQKPEEVACIRYSLPILSLRNDPNLPKAPRRFTNSLHTAARGNTPKLVRQKQRIQQSAQKQYYLFTTCEEYTSTRGTREDTANAPPSKQIAGMKFQTISPRLTRPPRRPEEGPRKVPGNQIAP